MAFRLCENELPMATCNAMENRRTQNSLNKNGHPLGMMDEDSFTLVKGGVVRVLLASWNHYKPTGCLPNT